MKNMRRKLLSLLLVMAMVCSLVPSALAAGEQTITGATLTMSPSALSFNVGETAKSLTVTNVTWPETNKYDYKITGYSFTPANNNVVTVSQTAASSNTATVTPVATSTTSTTISVFATGTRKEKNNQNAQAEAVATPATTVNVSINAVTTPTISISDVSVTKDSYTTTTAKLTNVAGTGYTVKWSVPNTSTVKLAATSSVASTGGASEATLATNESVYIYGVSAGTVTLSAQLYKAGVAVSGVSDTATVTVNTVAINFNVPSTLTIPTLQTAQTLTVEANVNASAEYKVKWSSSNSSVLFQNASGSSSAETPLDQSYGSSARSSILVYGLVQGSAEVTAILVDSKGATVAGPKICTVRVAQDINFTLTRSPSSTATVYLNRYYNDYNTNWYNRSATFTVTPVVGSSTANNANSYSYDYSWSITPSNYSSGALSTTNHTVGTTSYPYGGSSCTVDAYYLNSSTTTYTLTCTARAYNSTTHNNATLVDTASQSWTIRTDYTYHNYGSISASATVYANSTGYSLGSTDDAGGTSIVSELQSAVSSRYGYGSGWNSDRYYWDSSRSAWIDRTTGSIVSYDYNWNGWGNGWNNGYYGYDTLRYVTFSSVSTTGGSLSASTGTRYHVGGRTSYGSSALENVVFTPNGKSSTASFNITAYGDYGTYSGTITFNMSGTATPTTLTMSGTAGQNLNFKTSDFTSWWKGMYPSGNLSYVRFTSCSAGSLTNGVNGSSVVGNSTSCYASASGSQVAIGNLIYNSNSTGAATVTVNFTGYGSTTSSSSASTNRAGTLTITLAAGTPSVVSNLNVSYSCGASGVNLNATTFYNAVSASVTTASYITLGSPSSGTLTQNGVNVTSGSRFVLSGTSNNIGDVLYKPAAGFNGTATIPFVAYNSSNQTVATGNISIAVTQAAAPTTPGKTFPDTANHWSNTYVSVLASAGIVGGYDDGKFHPEREMTYGEALKLILLAAGYPEQAQGSGTNWAVNYLTLAINNGILPGSASSYTLSATVDRNTIAAMTAKALKLSPVTDTSTSPFVDSKDPYVLALNKAGIIFGDSSSGAAYYQGEKAFNRGEAAAIIYRIYNYRA